MIRGRHARWLLAALLFGALVLPMLVSFTGALTLGPYARGGSLQFLADFYADLARLRAASWVLLLGPVALIAVWRLARELLAHRVPSPVRGGSTSTVRRG